MFCDFLKIAQFDRYQWRKCYLYLSDLYRLTVNDTTTLSSFLFLSLSLSLFSFFTHSPFLQAYFIFKSNLFLFLFYGPQSLSHSLFPLFKIYPLLFSLQYIVENHAQTLLPQYMAMYRLTVNDTETYFVVMRNVFSPRLSIHRKYDLKVLIIRLLFADFLNKCMVLYCFIIFLAMPLCT